MSAVRALCQTKMRCAQSWLDKCHKLLEGADNFLLDSETDDKNIPFNKTVRRHFDVSWSNLKRPAHDSVPLWLPFVCAVITQVPGLSTHKLNKRAGIKVVSCTRPRPPGGTLSSWLSTLLFPGGTFSSRLSAHPGLWGWLVGTV